MAKAPARKLPVGSHWLIEARLVDGTGNTITTMPTLNWAASWVKDHSHHEVGHAFQNYLRDGYLRVGIKMKPVP